MTPDIQEAPQKKQEKVSSPLFSKVPVIVEVRPIDFKKWHEKVGEESFTRPKKLPALVSGDTMRYATGLSEQDVIDLKKRGVNYDLTDYYDADNPHPFWDSVMPVVKLENRTMIFDIKEPLNFIKVKIMRASKYVANSMKEWEEGHFPEATHVIFDEAVQAEIEAGVIETRNNAIIEASKLSLSQKVELILILDDKNLKGQSTNFITKALDKVINDDPGKFLRLLKMDTKDTSNRALVIEALQKSVLRKDGHRVLFHDSILGNDELDVASYLSKAENQDLKMRIMAQVNE